MGTLDQDRPVFVYVDGLPPPRVKRPKRRRKPRPLGKPKRR